MRSYSRPIPVLLTVPHLNPTASPYREMMAIVRLLPREDFTLTICSLRDGGFKDTAPVLAELGVDAFVARFRPTGRSARAFLASWRDQDLIDRRGPFAIQHSLDFTSSPFEAVMARMRSRIYLCSQRNLNQNGHRALLKTKLRLCRRVVAISDSVQQFLSGEGVPANKVCKVYLGIGSIPVSAEKRRGFFVCVGQIEPLKRQQDAISALARIADQYPEATLGIVGNVFDTGYLASLKQRASDLGVAGRVQFLGPRADVLELMASATGLIHCSESEAFGWVIIEAMSVGTPVIASAVDGPREILEDRRTGLLVRTGDVDGYAAAMHTLLSDPATESSLALNGRQEVARRFSERTMVESIRSLYFDCIGGTGAAPVLSSSF